MKRTKRLLLFLMTTVLILSWSASAYANVAQKKAIATTTKTIKMVTGERLRTYFQSRAGKKASYTIRNKNVLVLVENGRYMYARRRGKSVVTFKQGGKTARFTVTVENPQIAAGYSSDGRIRLRLVNTSFTPRWESSLPSVASIDAQTGVVTAHRPGRTTLKTKIKGVYFKYYLRVRGGTESGVYPAAGLINLRTYVPQPPTVIHTEYVYTITPAPTTVTTNNDYLNATVYLPATGQKYHRIPNCGNMDASRATPVTMAEAIRRGYGRCENCWR